LDYIFAQSSNANYSASVATAVSQLITDYPIGKYRKISSSPTISFTKVGASTCLLEQRYFSSCFVLDKFV